VFACSIQIVANEGGIQWVQTRKVGEVSRGIAPNAVNIWQRFSML
jgi:hypothetical protein